MFFGIANVPFRYKSKVLFAIISFRKFIVLPKYSYATNSLTKTFIPTSLATELQSSAAVPIKNANGQNRYCKMLL